jgi:uncharacterized membrane protein
MIEPILIVGVAIALTAWFMQHSWRRWRARRAVMRGTMGLEILAARYARGEIDRDEYLEKRGDILGYQVVTLRPPQSAPQSRVA